MSRDLVLFGTEEAAEPRVAGRVHVFRRDRWLGLVCVMCRVQGEVAAECGCDHAGDCPGLVVPVPAGVMLAGGPADGRPRWPVSPPPGCRGIS